MKPILLIFAILFLFTENPSAQEAPQPREETTITLTTDDGWKLNARFFPPAENAPTILFVHSQKRNLSEWNIWFPRLKSYGYGYLAIDLRGHGSSLAAPDGSTTSYRTFAISGSNNGYNKMIRDVDAALEYLFAEGITGDRIILAGSVLGANLAIKAAAIHQDIAMVAAFSLALNVNDVLSVNPLRAYGKKPLLLVAGTNRIKQYKEFQLLNDIAKQSCGRDNVTTIVKAKGFGAKELVNKYNIRKFFGWFRNPRRPFLVELSTASARPEDPEPENPEDTYPDEDME